MEVGESITDALRRELLEEIPTIEDIEVRELLEAHQLPLMLPEERGLMLLLYRIQAHVPVVKLSEEHNGFRWVDKNELDTICEEAHLDTGYKEVLLRLFK